MKMQKREYERERVGMGDDKERRKERGCVSSQKDMRRHKEERRQGKRKGIKMKGKRVCMKII